MTSEFKKIKNNEDTHYVLETATAGATSSSVVATAPGKKREDSILAQEKKETPKPRNFVAKNAKMGGAGQHKDKKKAAKQGDVKHKKPLAESYAEDLAKQVFDANPNIKDENAVLDAAWPIVVQDLGKKTAMSMFNYDEDFPSDLVSVYGWLQKGTSEGVNDLSYDAQSLITKLRRDVEEKRLKPTPEAVLAAARELAGDMEFAPQLLVKQVLGQGVAEGERTMSRAAKGHEKYGKDGMKALAKAGREGASEKKLDAIRDKHDNYNEGLRDPKDNPCWKGYKPVGTKKKAGKTVPNCVPKESIAEGFNGEYDDEAGMAQSNLITTARAVMGLLKTIKDRDNLPEWGQEKIAKAEMMLVSVWDYLQSQKQMGNDPQVEAYGRYDRRDAYQRDYDSSVSGMDRGNNHRDDERHDLDPSDWYIVKDGKMYKTSVYPRQEQEAMSRGYSRTRDEAKAKAEQQGVAEVAPPGWEKTVKAMKKHDEIDNPYALAWSMKNKGYKSHKKESADPYFESLRAKVEELAKK